MWKRHPAVDDELLDFAARGRDMARKVGAIFCEMDRYDAEGIPDGATCDPFAGYRICWWPGAGRLKAFYAETDKQGFVVLHLALIRSAADFRSAHSAAMDRVKDYL